MFMAWMTSNTIPENIDNLCIWEGILHCYYMGCLLALESAGYLGIHKNNNVIAQYRM